MDHLWFTHYRRNQRWINLMQWFFPQNSFIILERLLFIHDVLPHFYSIYVYYIYSRCFSITGLCTFGSIVQQSWTTDLWEIGVLVQYVWIIKPQKSTQTFLLPIGVTHELGSRKDMAMYFCQEGRHVWKWVSSKLFMLRMVRDQTSRPEASDPGARGPLIRLGMSYDHVVMGSGDNNWIHIILACFFFPHEKEPLVWTTNCHKWLGPLLCVL